MEQRWIDQVFDINSNIEITQKFTKYEDKLPLFKTVNGVQVDLFEFQRSVLQPMIDLENSHYIKNVKINSENYNNICCENVHVNTHAGRLSAPLGSGKTFIICALIYANKIPAPILPNYTPVPEINRVAKAENNKYIGFASILSLEYKQIQRPTLVFVGTSVFAQWVRTVREYTNLAATFVSSHATLVSFMNMVNDGSINMYDVIIIRNGFVKGRLDIQKDFIKTQRIETPNAIAVMCKNYQFARVIYDDFDTIASSAEYYNINAVFTWFVSSTAKVVGKSKSSIFIDDTKYGDRLPVIGYYHDSVTDNSILFNVCNICPSHDYVRESMRCCTPTYWQYSVKSPTNFILTLLKSMGDDRIENVLEMFSSGSFETAAKRLGFAANNISDVFRLILGTKKEIYEHAVKIVGFINDGLNVLDTLPPVPDDVGSGVFGASDYDIKSDDNTSNGGNLDDSNLKDAVTVYNNIKHDNNMLRMDNLPWKNRPFIYTKRDLTHYFRPIEFKYTDFKYKLNMWKKDAENHRDTNGKALEMVRGYVRNAECPICCINMNINDDNQLKGVIIIKCCNVMLCAPCAIAGSRMTNTGRCPHCRKEGITVNDFIYIANNTVSLEDLLNTDVPKELPINDADNEIEVENLDKLDLLMNIINGKKIHNREQIDVKIKEIVTGDAVLPDATRRKILVFASFEEALKKIEQKFTECKLKYLKLGGRACEIDNMVQLFSSYDENSVDVLLINSEKHCSGLNLQMATDLIFTHLINDRNIESQVIGRIMRCGRQHSANIHYIMYDTEIAQMHVNDRRAINNVVDDADNQQNNNPQDNNDTVYYSDIED